MSVASTIRPRRFAPSAAAAALIVASMGLSTSVALAQNFMPCQKVEADCEVQANAMNDMIAKSGTTGPYDSVYSVVNCQSWLASAEQTSTWPAIENGQPAFPCSP